MRLFKLTILASSNAYFAGDKEVSVMYYLAEDDTDFLHRCISWVYRYSTAWPPKEPESPEPQNLNDEDYYSLSAFEWNLNKKQKKDWDEYRRNRQSWGKALMERSIEEDKDREIHHNVIWESQPITQEEVVVFEHLNILS